MNKSFGANRREKARMIQKFEADSRTFALIRGHKFFRSKCSFAGSGFQKLPFRLLQPLSIPIQAKTSRYGAPIMSSAVGSHHSFVQPGDGTQQAACDSQRSAYNRNCCSWILTPHPRANRHFVDGHNACRHPKQKPRDEPAQRQSHLKQRTRKLGFLAVNWR